MSFIGDAIGSVVGGITGAKQQAKAAVQAGETQAAAAQAGIDEQARQFDAVVELMEPYVTGGTQALTAQSNLLGLGGADAEQQAIDAIKNSPTFQALLAQGNDALLQNASATGKLRGGDTQAVLAQFAPSLLNQQIQQRFSNLGNLSALGQASASGQAAAGQSTANSISSLLAQQGAATAGGQLASGSVARTAFGDVLKIGSAIAGGF